MRSLQLALLISLAATAGPAVAAEPPAEATQPSPAVDAPERYSPPANGNIAGTITQTMDVAQYTYVEIDTGEGLVWAAGPVTEVEVGDSVEVPNSIQMINFHSTALDRTFDQIYLAPAIQVK